MFATKPLASLSSGLLARKGGARPAMRPQTFAVPAPVATIEDLGWNDMGVEPAPALPPVLVERDALRDEVETIGVEVTNRPELKSLTVAVPPPEPRKATTPRAAPGTRAKAAFTLRIEPDRHLRLRLASAVTHRSAQQLVTEALDAFLATLPDVEELARQCSSPDRLGD